MLTRRSRTVSMLVASLLAWVAVLAVGAPASQALTFRLTGVIDEINDPYADLTGRVSLGDPYVAYLTYDPLATPYDTDSNGARYRFSPTGTAFSISLHVGAITTATDPAGTGWIRVNDGPTITSPGLPDLLQMTTSNVLATGANVLTTEILLSDWGQTAFSSTDLPDSLDLDDFDVGHVAFAAFESSWALAFGSIQTLTLIPEPGTATLVLVGLAGMALRRRPRATR